MILLGTAAEVRALDAAMIEGLLLPGVCLMETASAAVARVIQRNFADAAERGVCVVCGSGNNGGDGYAVALASGLRLSRVVLAALTRVERRCVHHARRGSADRHSETAGLEGPGLIVDLFGTGLSRPLEGAVEAVVHAMNASAAPVVVVDLPSGLDADTGQIHGSPCAPTPPSPSLVPSAASTPAPYSPIGDESRSWTSDSAWSNCLPPPP